MQRELQAGNGPQIGSLTLNWIANINLKECVWKVIKDIGVSKVKQVWHMLWMPPTSECQQLEGYIPIITAQ